MRSRPPAVLPPASSQPAHECDVVRPVEPCAAPDGSIAALNYANALVLVPQTLLPAALATALFPQLAEMVARGNWRGAVCSTRIPSESLAFAAGAL